MSSSLNRGVEATSIPALSTTGTGAAYSVPPDVVNTTVIIKGTGVTSGGTIAIEEADNPDYTGIWSLILSVNASDVNGTAQKAVHIPGLIRAIRARITSNITGGGSIEVGIIAYGD